MVDDTGTSGVRWLSPEQLEEWVALMALVMTLPANLDAQLRRETGLNLFEYHVLASLSIAPEAKSGRAIMSSLSPGYGMP